MSKLLELDKIDRVLKESEIGLKSILNNIENIEKELNVLIPRKNELEQSIEFLKRPDTAPIVQEYKKIKAEFSKTKARLILLANDKKKAILASKDVEEIIAKLKNDYAALMKTSEDNVLTMFGGSRGKK